MARITQAELARSCGLSVPTVRLLEVGRGNLDSWRAPLDPLGLELIGRNLPPGESLGSKLASLRRRRRLSQRELADLVGVSQPNVVALEGQGGGRLDPPERSLESSVPVPTSPRAGRPGRSTRTPGTPRSAT